MKRIALALMIVAALVAGLIPVAAQDGGLLGLSGEDQQLLQGANLASATNGQFTFTYDVSLTLSGPTEVDVTLGGEGGLDVPGEMAFFTISTDALGAPADAELRVVGDLIYGRATDPTIGEDTGWFSLNGNEAA
ncbi:MAG: hypothetical protein AAF125_25915, partial [Chloroflexota bacterium]